MDTPNTELIRGHVDTIILNALVEKDRYGYEILEIISNLSDGRYEIKQPTLYSCLKRLEKQGFICSYFGDESNGARRRYYQLTEKGRETLAQDQREWEFSRTIINRLLSDKEVDLRTVPAPFDPSELRPLTKRVKVYENDAEREVAPEASPITAVAAESTPVTPMTETNYVPEEAAPKADDPAVIRARNALYGSSAESVSAEAEARAVRAEQPRIFAEPPIYVPAEERVTPEPMRDEHRKIYAEAPFYRPEPEINEEVALQIKEKQTAASKLLQIGEFAPREHNLLGDEVPGGTRSAAEARADVGEATARTAFTTSDGSLNYREALSAVYATDVAPTIPSAEITEEAEHLDNTSRARQFNDLKISLMDEGFKLKAYNRANSTNYYYMNYVYSNKLFRDTALFTYLVLAIELLAMIIGYKTFGSITTFIIIGAVGLLIPVIPTAIWVANPTKRVKAKFNFNSALVNSLITFIVVSAIAIIVSLVSPSLDVDFGRGSAYIPYIFAADIPIAVLIYGFLYKTNNYHLKK